MAQVSVVIPVYNIERHLRQCLDSVAGQSLRDMEVICVDDGSTDDSPKILADYASKDSRFQIITQSNAGPGAARNTGMAKATGKYLIFLDSDDWFEPDFLERMVAKAESTEADVTICRAAEFDSETGRELPSEWMLKSEYLPGETFSPEDIAEHIFQFTYGWPWDKLYRAGFVKRAGVCYPALPNSEDLVFVLQGLALAEKIAVVETVLVHHRVNRASSVSNSRHRDPEAAYKAVRLLEDALRERRLYETFERSFLNWAMEFLIWNVASLERREARKQSFKRLRKEWLPALPFSEHPAKYYDRFSYAKLLLARFAPCPVFYGVNRTYHKWKDKRGEKRNGEAVSGL